MASHSSSSFGRMGCYRFVKDLVACSTCNLYMSCSQARVRQTATMDSACYPACKLPLRAESGLAVASPTEDGGMEPSVGADQRVPKL